MSVDTKMDEFECYQAQGATQVVCTNGDGAVVTISRAVGSPRARALMRYLAIRLIGDQVSAEARLRTVDNDPDEPAV